MSEEKTEVIPLPWYASEDTKKGVYANVVSVSFNAENPDFYLDFLVMTHYPQFYGALVSRVFLPLPVVKNLHSLLGDALKNYDDKLEKLKTENNGKENT